MSTPQKPPVQITYNAAPYDVSVWVNIAAAIAALTLQDLPYILQIIDAANGASHPHVTIQS